MAGPNGRVRSGRAPRRTGVARVVTDAERAAVWKGALGVWRADVPCEANAARAAASAYAVQASALDADAAATAALRAALLRTRVVSAPPPEPAPRRAPPLTVAGADARAALARIVGVYLASADVEFHADMLHVAAVFYEVMPSEAAAYHAFSALMHRHRSAFVARGARAQVATFLSALRHTYPQLFEHVDSEDVDMDKWVSSWFRSLLAKQMQRPSLLRLWDAYFTALAADCVDFHPHVCLVLVGSISSQLQDIEDGEGMQAFLCRPNIKLQDASRILLHAKKLRDTLRSDGVV